MSFVIRLWTPGLTDDIARRISDRAAAEGSYPIQWRRSHRRRRLANLGRLERIGPSMWIEDQLNSQYDLFADAAPQSRRLVVNVLLVDRFAALVRILADELPAGFTICCGWGDGRPTAASLTIDAFLQLIRAGEWREDVEYAVSA